MNSLAFSKFKHYSFRFYWSNLSNPHDKLLCFVYMLLATVLAQHKSKGFRAFILLSVLLYYCHPCGHISREEANYTDFEFPPYLTFRVKNSAAMFLMSTLGNECYTQSECLQELRRLSDKDAEGMIYRSVPTFSPNSRSFCLITIISCLKWTGNSHST